MKREQRTTRARHNQANEKRRCRETRENQGAAPRRSSLQARQPMGAQMIAAQPEGIRENASAEFKGTGAR
jgi:hypothetical protein